MGERIGIVTGGGDCPGLNAVILQLVTKAAAKCGWETIGFLGGYDGILEPQRYMELDLRFRLGRGLHHRHFGPAAHHGGKPRPHHGAGSDGRYAGWIALYAGVAGGADVILIPEIPFAYDCICAKIEERDKHFTLVVAAEGAREKGGQFVTAAQQVANRERGWGHCRGDRHQLEKRTGKKNRAFACWGTCSAVVGAPRTSTGPCARCSAPRPWS